ncbi:Cysteine-rich receptor-like protein kinase 10 [Glycine soja]
MTFPMRINYIPTNYTTQPKMEAKRHKKRDNRLTLTVEHRNEKNHHDNAANNAHEERKKKRHSQWQNQHSGSRKKETNGLRKKETGGRRKGWGTKISFSKSTFDQHPKVKYHLFIKTWYTSKLDCKEFIIYLTVIYFQGRLSNGQSFYWPSFSLEGKEKLLVYEFVPNKSLDYFIFDPTKKAQLDWDRQYKIIRGIARGLTTALCIIHHDLKASNVPLDEKMIPKIPDFDPSLIINIIDPTLNNSSQNEMIRCIHTGLLCIQENLANRPTMANVALMLNRCSITLPVPTKPAFLMDSATTSLPNMSWEVLLYVGSALNSSLNCSSQKEMITCIHIGLICVQENLANRPIMANVALMLNSCSLTLVPTKPAFFMDNATRSLPKISWEVHSAATTAHKSAN